MAIDRTNYNALVDDDGSNTVGTIWTKNQVKIVVLDPIDTLLANRVAPAFSAGNFTGAGSMTVTVDSGDVNAYAYQVHNKLMTIWFELVTFTIAGTPAAEVRIAIPGGFTAAQRAWNLVRISDNGTLKTGLAFVGASATFVGCYVDLTTGTNWAASTNNSGIAGQISFPVN